MLTLAEQALVYRRRSKITQEELGNLLGVSQQVVGRWEAGHVDMPEIYRLFIPPCDRLDDSELLYIERRRAGIGVSELAQMAGVSRIAIYHAEHGGGGAPRYLEVLRCAAT